MVIEWRQSASAQHPVAIRAARYVRMSTEHQKYSTENQADAIDAYAAKRGYDIVRTYSDEGKSGLNLDGRESLKRLLEDVESGQADYRAILVYDVSRWGRFQDLDEAASYELRCRRKGVEIHYCAEQFENDGSMSSAIVKTVKRAMAGEYSRELSVKVHAGQRRLIELGYRQGGAAGYGLRRVLVDEHGVSKGQLNPGQHKSIQTDRVILVPGPAEEVERVRWIYEQFVLGRTESEIAETLAMQGLVADGGRPWTRGIVHQILINEKYIGNNVWNRTSFKLKQAHVRNDPTDWVRAEGVFEAIVDHRLFDRARTIIEARTLRLTDAEMIEALQRIYEQSGMLTGLIIDESNGCPSSSAYQARFGSLLKAYALVGYVPDHDYSYIDINRQLRLMHPQVVREVVAGIEREAGSVSRDPKTDLLHINREFTASVVIARCRETQTGMLRWHIRLDHELEPDLTIAVRMAAGNAELRDFYLLPRLDMRAATFRLCQHNGLSFDGYRFGSLEGLFDLSARVPLLAAA